VLSPLGAWVFCADDDEANTNNNRKIPISLIISNTAKIVTVPGLAFKEGQLENLNRLRKNS
jgi:hypothetical protein